ncbi:hypothetical protein ABBQ38_011224 [Trebouxia sp. C0009 RCD-2024]
MEVESQLAMSLDDIINKHKKERPVGNKKQQARPGQKGKQSLKVGAKNLAQPGRGGQNSSKAKVRIATQKNSVPFGRKRSSQAGPVVKPSHKGPSTQSKKGRQAGAPAVAFDEIKRNSPMKPLKITIKNDTAQRTVLPRAQPRPVIPTPSQGRLVMPGQAQLPRARSMQAANGYAPAVQPRHAEEAYVVAAVPARQAYTETVGRGMNNAASYLRDPYRGDDFEPRALGGMRSEVTRARTQNTRAYESLLDDSLREDGYDRPRSSAYSGRQSNRERSTYRH